MNKSYFRLKVISLILLLFINQKLSIEFVHIIMHLDPNTCLSIQGAKSKQSLRIKSAVQLGYSDS